MSTRLTSDGRGRILVVGSAEIAPGVLARLSGEGFACEAVEEPSTLGEKAARVRPEAILFSSGGPPEREVLRRIRQDPALRELPLLGDLTTGTDSGLRRLGLHDWIREEDELTLRLESVLRAQRLIERDALNRQRIDALLEITQAATSTLELSEILRLAVEKVSKVIPTDRCSVVLVEGAGPRTATVVASREAPSISSLRIDLARYPELRRALETRQSILVEDARSDPLMNEVQEHIEPLGVRSILVQPLVCQDDLVGALFLRLSRTERSFGPDEQEFARAVGGALANSVRNSQLHTALKRKRDDLESAYVDRYRELSEANHRLRELNRLKDELLAICSHDLRAPLQVLLGHGRMLLDGNPTAEQTHSAEAIVRQGRKILGLVESLLDKGRGEQGRVSMEPVLVDVAELCKESARDLEILADGRGLSLRSETPESLMVMGDEVKLREVLQNLITNALQHARGAVVVRAQRLRRPDGQAARILVQDDGPGISADQLHLIFDRYRHGPGGTGLGLSICREFVELHGGEIWAEAAPGGGTVMVFTVPLGQQVPGPAEAAGPAALPEEQPRILVVEDEPQIAAVMAEILRSRYRVEVARDGAEGVAKARALRPDLILMDVFLPKLDGLDAMMALKGSSDTADIPVILLSAHQAVAEKLRALNLGAVDYIHKPFQALELLSRSERALQLRQAERDLERSRTLLRKTGSDPDTGLLDASGLLARLEQELARVHRYGRKLSLVLLSPERDLGERLRTCATLVRARVRSPDVVAHLGEGVLVAVLPECTPDDARLALGRLLAEMEQESQCKFRITLLDASAVESKEGGAAAAPLGDASRLLEELRGRAAV